MQEIARNNFEHIMGTLKEMPRSMLFVVSFVAICIYLLSAKIHNYLLN